MKKVLLLVMFSITIMSISSQELIVSFNAPEDSPIFSLLQVWLGEVGDRAGVSFKLISQPLERAEAKVLSGEIDGDVGRTKFVYEDDSRVIYTTYPATVSFYHMFTTDPAIDPFDTETLIGLKFVTSRGNKVNENWIEENGVTNVIYSKDAMTALKIVSSGRADYFLASNVYIDIAKSDPTLENLIISEKPVLQVPTYIVLNAKHKDLVPLISNAMKEMAESGRTAELFGL